jgi:hypothetical protein
MPHAIAVPPRYDTEPIVFDFVNPDDARRRCNGRSGQAGLKRHGALNTAPL